MTSRYHDDETAIAAARRQSLLRIVNERIEGLNEAFDSLMPGGEWLCECADATCLERLKMSISEYEAVRDHPAHFPVHPGHVAADFERIVAVCDGYVIVEKIGVGREIAVASDPRAAAPSAA